MISRASGRTSANAGRSPKPSKWASSGTRARRIASRPLRPTVTTVRSPPVSVICWAANRIVFVFSGAGQAAVGRDQDDQALAGLAPDEERMVLAAEHAGEVGEDLVELLGVRPRGERRLLGALELRRGHELHRPGDLLDVLRRLDSPTNIALASHRCGRLAVRRLSLGADGGAGRRRKLVAERRR